MFHRRSATLILTDLVVNLGPRALPLPMAVLVCLGSSAIPHGRAPVYLRLLIRAKRRRACCRAASDRPGAAAVIFAHGAWFEHAGTTRLQSLRCLIEHRDHP